MHVCIYIYNYIYIYIYLCVCICVYTFIRIYKLMNRWPLGSRSRHIPVPAFTGLLSNQGEKSIHFYFIMVPLRKSIKVWYSKAQSKTPRLRSESLGPGTINDEEEHREACNSRLGFSRVSGFRILGLGLRILLGFGV